MVRAAFVCFSRKLVASLAFFVILGASSVAWAFTDAAPQNITDYGASVWQQGEGLPDNALRAILQTRDGYLWAGTKAGLLRFNGVSFETYSARSGQLADSEVRALAEGADGSLYIGTMSGGLTILKDGKFTTLRKKDGLADDIVRALLRSRDGSLWIGTDRGLNRLRGGLLHTFDGKHGLVDPSVRALLEDAQGRIWVGTRKGVFLVDGERLTDKSRDELVRDREVSALSLDASGRVLLATSDQRLFRSDGAAWEVLPKAQTPSAKIEVLHLDPFGHVWMGTKDGAFRLIDDELQHYPEFVSSRTKDRYVDAIPITDIWAIATDREGNVWLGSSHSGLIRLRSGRFRRITVNDGLPVPEVTTLAESRSGELYIGTPRGLVVSRGNQVTPIALENGDESPCFVAAAARGDDDVIWVGGSCGVFSGTGTTFAKYPLAVPPKDRLHAIARTRDGHLWLGYGVSGLLRITPGKSARWFKTEDGLLSNRIRTILETDDGSLLVGSLDGGVNRISGDQVTPLPTDVQAMTAVYHIVRASDGSLWFATRRGLVRRKDGRDVLLAGGNGMPPVEFFYKILEDAAGHFWLTSSIGIFRIPVADLHARADGRNTKASFAWFTNEDGMPSTTCAQTTPETSIPCRGGELCFATVGGVAIIDPKSASPSRFVPPVYIESAAFDGQSIGLTKGVVLGPGRNDIAFDFAGLELGFPGRMRFRYRLVGRDQGFTQPVERRTARYTNLAPGAYRFEVMASNSDGVWSGAPASFAFTIAPRFYQTRSFHVLCGVLLLALIALVIRVRTRALKLRTMQLEALVEKRTEAVVQRNRDMRLVLDNVDQGFLTLDVGGKLALEHSAVIDEWFGPYLPETLFVTFMGAVDPDFASNFSLAFEQVVDGDLPLTVAVDQLPTRLERAGSVYTCAYRALLDGEKLTGLLIVITNVTAQLLQERQQANGRELLAMFEALAEDRGGFWDFFDSSRDGIERLAQATVEEQKVFLHTLKGNAGVLGLGIVMRICHELEDKMAEQSSALSASEIGPLAERWAKLSEVLQSFLGESGRDMVELHFRELDLLAQEVSSGATESQILDRLASWRLEDTTRPLRRLGRYASGLAQRLGKGEIEVEIQAHGIRLHPETWSSLWRELVHVVRNAVDHGLESPSERRDSHKSESARLRLSVAIHAGKLVIEIEDDGRGIDWALVREAAIQRNLPSETHDDLVQCLFASGLTTRSEVTSLSGRGIGLSAVKYEIEGRGGMLSVRARQGEGTCFAFEIPLGKIGPRFGIDPGTALCAATPPRASDPPRRLSVRAS
jgi:ligand-binding sensor domain-containing protein/HPt (histidine-containing phosphotransfer) domain-containing protein